MEFGLFLTIASALKEVYDLSQKGNLIREIDKAYHRALERWCINDEIRRKCSSRFKNLNDLTEFISGGGDPEKLGVEYLSFLPEWESELRNNTLTLGYINTTHSKAIEGKIDKILGEVSSTFSPLQYPQQQNYIRRGIRNYDKADSLTYYLTTESYKVHILVDYIIDDGLAKRIVLYSEAQAGKTTELRNLAHETQASGLFNTYLYDLKLFASGSLVDGSIIKYLTSDNSKRNLLILDGLDEVKDEIRPAAIHQIVNLASAYPNLSIVVSCRGNFESTNEVAGFTKLYLNPLSLADVEAHVDSPKLFDEIKRKELYELVYNPFYLKAIKEHYSEKGSLPETKSDIYDYVIDKSLQAEEERFTGHSLIRVRKLTLPLLQKMAFCMQLTEKSLLSYEELTKGLSFSEKQVEDCIRYSIFKMDDEGNYGFVHNAFKEYLTAKHLSKMSFDQLKAVIAFPGTDLLRPSLYNTVLLLVSILKEGDPLVGELIDWIAEHNTDVLFMCEHHFLSEARSAEILKSYLEYLKKYSEYISYQLWDKAMTFSNTRETILYLLEEAKKEKRFSSHQSNIVALLQYADMSKLSETERDDVYDFGIKLIRQNRDAQDSQYALFHIPRNEYFKTPGHIARLHSAIGNSENPMLLLEVFKLIHSSGLSDEYFDWAISKREFIKD